MNHSGTGSETTDVQMGIEVPGDGSADGDKNEPKKVLVRHTPWRWAMLTFGCFFLMGSYFCYDNPAPLKSTLKDPPYNLSNS